MLQLAKGALDHVAFLVENKITISWLFSVDLGRNHCPNIVVGQPCQERIGIVAFVGKQRDWRPLGQVDQVLISFAVCRFANCQVEGERSSKGISQAVKFTGEPAPRAAKSASMSPPFPPAADTWARTVVLSML